MPQSTEPVFEWIGRAVAERLDLICAEYRLQIAELKCVIADYRAQTADLKNERIKLLDEIKTDALSFTGEVASQIAKSIDKMDARISELKDGIDGKDGLPGEKGEPGPSGEVGPRGEKGETGEVGAPGEPGNDGATGERGEKGDPGEAGKDGVITTKLAAYKGVFEDGASYDLGDFVTWGGSLWHCNGNTVSKPGEGNGDWQLAVKRGRDGKDGKPGDKGERGLKGDPGQYLAMTRNGEADA